MADVGVFAVSYKIRHLTNLGDVEGIDQLIRSGFNKSYLFDLACLPGQSTTMQPETRVKK